MDNTTPDTTQEIHRTLKMLFILAALVVVIFFVIRTFSKTEEVTKDTFVNNQITLTPEEIAEKEKRLNEWDNKEIQLTPEEIRLKEELLKRPLNQ